MPVDAAATTIKLNVAATLLTPSIGADAADHHAHPVSCGHEGAASAVATGSATLAVTESVTVTLAGLPPLTLPLVPSVGLPGKTLKIYACTGVSWSPERRHDPEPDGQCRLLVRPVPPNPASVRRWRKARVAGHNRRSTV